MCNMGDNIAASSVTSLHSKRSKYKYDKDRLPTPPPDPTKETTGKQEQTEKEKENDFLNYLDSLQMVAQHPALAQSASIFSPAIASEDAFDHLERLYKLMDQMLTLKEQNSRLHRKIRDLEYLSKLHKLQTGLSNHIPDEDISDIDKDATFAESVFDSILNNAKRDNKFKGNAQSKFRQSILRRQRNRSSSVNIESPPLDSERSFVYKSPRRTSENPSENQLKASKVSKWTKVKAAFKWEKASPTVASAKSHDSGLGGMLPVNMEVARYLRVPSVSDEMGLSPSDSGAAEISTPGSLSNASSTDDIHKDTKNLSDEYHSSDDEAQYLNNENIPHSKDDQSENGKATSSKSRRTPWSRMKDIIQTRNSFKKRRRFSARSDETKADEAAYSESEDAVFEDEMTGDIVLTVPSSPTAASAGKQYYQENDIPKEIIERYQQVVAEEERASNNEGNLRKVSRWSRVKKAFLTSSEDKEYNQQKPEEFTKKAQEEINRNYKQLQQKLSQEFQEKLMEWERGKASSSSSGALVTSEEPQDPAFLKKIEEWKRIKSHPSPKQLQCPKLQSEENLPPEFRKKLEEWKKIKKSSTREDIPKRKTGERPKWKSVNRGDEHKFEYPQLSEEFLKKLEEWKQIKASGGPIYSEDSESRKSAKDNKTPSPRMVRKLSPSKQKKTKDVQEQELQWFEKELNKIEKEKQRLERERQKFLEREERLTKLRRSIMGNNKKEVLVHTRSGFHRFEGISRKFTQKLYEWEKAQGIAPEESTFALLTSCYAPDICPPSSQTQIATGTLTRSKSADSVVTSALNLTCPVISHQPSSLSLNDVENLEKECLAGSKASSVEYISHAEEVGEDEEPEALIVEVEDIVEETAAPLVENHLAKQHTPIYQHESIKSMCASEACLAPKVRRSESARAQTNYNLIEESIVLMKQIGDTEDEIQRLAEAENTMTSHKKLNEFHEKQKVHFARLCDKLTRLQEANTKVISNITNDESGNIAQRLVEVLEAIQDLSLDLIHTADKLDQEVSTRSVETTTSKQSLSVQEGTKQINAKVLELRRLLSYICAASDMTAPGRKKLLGKRGILKKHTTVDVVESREDVTTVKEEEGTYVKSGNYSPSQGAIKKRIRHRQKSLQSRMFDESEDDDDEIVNRNNTERKVNKHKKLLRARSVADDSGAACSDNTDVGAKEKEEAVVVSSIAEKFVVPTETNFVSAALDIPQPPDSPVTVFVKTTRKLFTPIIEKATSQVKPGLVKSLSLPTARSQDEQLKVVPNKEEGDLPVQSGSITASASTVEDNKEVPTRLPPLPGSPIPQRKALKDNMSPNIRIMLARYNQKISEQDASGRRSGGSSGSNSPVAWRSPTFERRVKAQTEKYQEEVKKQSPLLGERREVQKSASVGIMHCCKKQFTKPRRESDAGSISESTTSTNEVSKSSSATNIAMKTINPVDEDAEKRKSLFLKLSINKSPFACLPKRSQKLQQAKEEFLNSGSISAPVTTKVTKPGGLQFPTRNRLSQISVDSESSCDSTAFEGVLIKSASAGMINIDADAYRKINPEVHREGYVSLPRSSKKGKEGFLESITSKFRKIKMRKGRDKNKNAKMNAVSALCRQSLVVDIAKTSECSSLQEPSSSQNSNR